MKNDDEFRELNDAYWKHYDDISSARTVKECKERFDDALEWCNEIGLGCMIDDLIVMYDATVHRLNYKGSSVKYWTEKYDEFRDEYRDKAMIKPTCGSCGHELKEFGALLLGPPEGNGVRKDHLCVNCYRRITEREIKPTFDMEVTSQ